MKIVAAVLTRNQVDYERQDLFQRTIESLAGQVDELHVLDNGSIDGTHDIVRKGDAWIPHLSTHANTTSGFGTWTCCRILAGTDADVCLVSDDDMDYQLGFTKELAAWWHDAPEKLTLTGCHVEPEYFWNEVGGHVNYGGVRGILRASTGAASWTFLRDNYERLSNVARGLPINRQGHWDVPMCRGLTDQFFTIGQLDLATHIGQGRSSWGNRTEDLYGWDVEPVKAAL